jgi:peptidoglycan/xylan/chitin deacetylase (PgdA/CDA1 family)
MVSLYLSDHAGLRPSGPGVPFAAAALVCTVLAALGASPQPSAPAIEDSGVSILVYHRFGATVKDTMTVRTSTLRWQLDYLKQHGHPVIPLHALIAHLRGLAPAPPPRSVVMTADDGHASVFTEMLPLVREYHIPVTLFIYPSAISNASYAMTWEQLDALQRTGLFDIQSHTYWHPNFKTERRRQSPAAYRSFATMQLVKSRTVLQNRLGVDTDSIAWPFGIFDDQLIDMASDAGYIAGFTIERRVVTRRERLMALPRFLVTDGASGHTFAAMLPRDSR